MVGPPIEPYRQGAFDGFCGVYALVNAARLLQPGLEHAGAEDLFIHLVECLEAKDLPLSTAVTGLGQRELRRGRRGGRLPRLGPGAHALFQVGEDAARLVIWISREAHSDEVLFRAQRATCRVSPAAAVLH